MKHLIELAIVIAVAVVVGNMILAVVIHYHL